MYSGRAQYQQHLIVERETDEWITGTEPMTIEQRIYLRTLCQEAGEIFDDNLSKISATERIAVLQQKISRKL